MEPAREAVSLPDSAGGLLIQSMIGQFFSQNHAAADLHIGPLQG